MVEHADSGSKHWHFTQGLCRILRPVPGGVITRYRCFSAAATDVQHENVTQSKARVLRIILQRAVKRSPPLNKRSLPSLSLSLSFAQKAREHRRPAMWCSSLNTHHVNTNEKYPCTLVRALGHHTLAVRLKNRQTGSPGKRFSTGNRHGEKKVSSQAQQHRP